MMGHISLPHESVAAGSGSSSSRQDSNSLGGGSAPTGEISGSLGGKDTGESPIEGNSGGAHGENYLVPIVVLRCMTVCLHL